ncbi:ChrR family anti-sigma-E factor [Hyphococcus lacteus]|uniref:ChrR family anti-sigma-E factor n=1 Tax=Hyphococcus lacteus TaxID=3143536 RepID=A0ABV3Z3A8_9PROT
MSNRNISPRHTASEEWLASYSSGALSELKRLVIECQSAIEPSIKAKLNVLDDLGGAFIESAQGEKLSDDFLDRLSAALPSDTQSKGAQNAERRSSRESQSTWIPRPLQNFLDNSEINLKWKKSGPGVERAFLGQQENERLYLLKAKPGLKLPAHSHSGQEWTLILQGGYHVNGQGFIRGDLHCEDETCMHQPVIDDDGEDCISLVVDEGALIFDNPILNLLQPITKI